MEGDLLDKVPRQREMLEILIVDDQEYFCHLFREMLNKCPCFHVVGEAYDSQRAIERIEELNPDVILMDVEMEGLTGLEAAHMIRKRFPNVQVVLTSMYDEEEYSRLAANVGALAFIPKKDLSAPVLAKLVKSGCSDTPCG